MRRREVFPLLGGAAAAWPLAARGQHLRRIGVLLSAAADDAPFQARLAAFVQALAALGWVVGRDIQIEARWATSETAEIRRHAGELAALAPDVILASGTSTVGPMMQATRSVPIVFPIGADPVGAGFVDSLARPGGNVTGFLSFDFGLSGKWLELLHQAVPAVTRVGVLRQPTVISGIGQFSVIQALAPSLKMEVVPLNAHDGGEIERTIAAFARMPNGGLIATSGPLSQRYRDLIVKAAAEHKLPAVYYERAFAAAGGLMSYGPDYIEQYRRAAGYVSRILKGEKPGDLPVQTPNRYELVLNLKTAKALGLDMPPTLLARADAMLE